MEVPVGISPRGPTAVVGAATVIDTATLQVAGFRIELVGLVAVANPGLLADAQTAIDRHNENVICSPFQPNATRMRCAFVTTREDIGELFGCNGYATVQSDSNSQGLRRAEKQVREARAGVWAR